MVIICAATLATAVPGQGPLASRATELDESILFGTALGAYLRTFLGGSTVVEGGHILLSIICSEDVA
jgi:hypothetical protein